MVHVGISRSNRYGNVCAKRQSDDTVASHTTSFVGDCCLEEQGIDRPQGIGVGSEGSSSSEDVFPYIECRNERRFFTQTADEVEVEKSSHLQDIQLNVVVGADFERMHNTFTVSHSAVEYGDKLKSCLKKSSTSCEQTVACKTELEPGQLEHGNDLGKMMVWLPFTYEEKCAVSVAGVDTESPVNLESLQKKEECCSTRATDIELFKVDIEKESRPRKSILHSKDVLTPKRRKTVRFACDGVVFVEDCASTKQNGYSNLEWRNSGNVIGTNKDVSIIRKCEVRLERLSPEILNKYLSPKKEHQGIEMRSVTEKRPMCKARSYSYRQKSSGKHGRTKEKTQGSVIFHQVGMFEKQNCNNTWGDVKLDSWGNVRYISKEHVDLSESEEDWHGWQVHIETLHNLPNAQLYIISDGMKESRTVVWNSSFEPVTTTQDQGIQVPEQTTYLCNKRHCNEEGYEDISFDVSRGEEFKLCGW